MLEAKIIYALNENKKAKLECDEVDQLDAEEVDNEVEECDDQEVNEVVKKVRGGKVIKLKKPPKKGFKVIDGKYVKMSAKEKAARRKAIKKAQRKAHSGGAKLARRKSMKVRRMKGLNDSFRFDEQAFQELMNASLNNIFESVSEQYYSFTIESVNSAAFNGSDLVLECEVSYEDGVTATGTFTVEGFDYTSGTYNVLESSNLLDEINGTMSVELVVEGATVIPVEFSHDVTVNGEEMSESFVFESVKSKKMNKMDTMNSTMTDKLPSGSPSLMAEINNNCNLYLVGSVEEDGIFVCLIDDYNATEYVLFFDEEDEKEAAATFMSMAKYINPDDFDIEEVARKFKMEEI